MAKIIKYIIFFTFLVSWKVETCGTYTGTPKRIIDDGYGGEHGVGTFCEPEVVERRRFFKTEREVVDFVINAPSNVSDFKIQEFARKK